MLAQISIFLVCYPSIKGSINTRRSWWMLHCRWLSTWLHSLIYYNNRTYSVYTQHNRPLILLIVLYRSYLSNLPFLAAITVCTSLYDVICYFLYSNDDTFITFSQTYQLYLMVAAVSYLFTFKFYFFTIFKIPWLYHLKFHGYTISTVSWYQTFSTTN